jgi:hypothetical protein
VRRIDKALPGFRVSSSGFLSVNAGLHGSEHLDSTALPPSLLAQAHDVIE